MLDIILLFDAQSLSINLKYIFRSIPEQLDTPKTAHVWLVLSNLEIPINILRML